MDNQYINRILAYVQKRPKISAGVFGVVCLVFGLAYALFIQTPQKAPYQAVYVVEDGATVASVAQSLKETHLIDSANIFTFLVLLFNREGGIQAGEYIFTKPHSIYGVMKRLTTGDHQLVPLKITIPEGANTQETAAIFAKQLPKFKVDTFLAEAKEGYMFPDTYFFLPHATSGDVLAAMSANFEEKIKSLNDKIVAFNKPFADILSVASIIEEEARTPESRRIISGILWKRLEIGMPLQVDVTFQYVNGKNTYELSKEDLEIDSPYNTYKYTGLPPTPISNPGFDSIEAAVSPAETNYLYFLSSKNGTMYYAADFEGHKKNRALYLGN